MYQENEKLIAQRIRGEYVPKEETKLSRLRKLDAKVKRPAEIFAYSFGSVSSLVLGVGMCLAMGVIGAALPMAVGIVIGIAGIGMATANYFIYKKMLRSAKKKHADEILSLSEQVLNGQANN